MKQAGKFIIYQILLRVFGNTNENCVPGGSLHSNGTGKFSSITTQVLDKLKELAVTHVWYTGVIEHATKTSFEEFGIRKDNPAVIKGEAGSPYAIKDYYDVNPYLANSVPDRMAEFEQLVSRTHESGLKVIIDFVPNHLAREYNSDSLPLDRSYNPYVTGAMELDGSAPIQIVSKNRPPESFGQSDNPDLAFSPQNNFYYLWGQELDLQKLLPAGADGVEDCRDENCVKEESAKYVEKPAKATGNDCFTPMPGVNDWYETVKLNYGVDYCGGGARCFDPRPKTWDMMLDVLLFWASKGVDGFRCDMAEMVPVEFWHWAVAAVKKVYPNLIFVAEVYNPSQYDSYLHWGGFDYLYDKVGLYDNLKAITQGHSPAHSITDCWQSIGDMQYTMLNFLENHDEQRVASDFNIGNPFKAIPELAVSLMLNTAPFMLYFGQEFGERGMLSEGFSGTDGRTSIFDYCSAPSVVRFLNSFQQTSADNKTELYPAERRLYALYRHLFSTVMGEEALRSGSTYDLEYANFNTPGFDPGCCFAFARKSADSILFVAVDFTQTRSSLPVLLPTHLFEFWSIDPGHYSMQNLAFLPDEALPAGFSVHFGTIADNVVENSTMPLANHSSRGIINRYNQSIISNLSPDSCIHLPLNEYGVAILKCYYSGY